MAEPRPEPLARGRDNLASKGATRRKLNGQFFTPDAAAAAMVDQVAWPEGSGGALLDPCCGDGAYLEAAVRKAAAMGGDDDARRRLIRERIWGWDVDAAALDECRARLTAVADDLGLPGALPRIEHRDALDGLGPDERVDAVVTNPPYLEAKRMPDALKARVKRHCPAAGRGAFDLYGAFVELACRWADEVCLLIPNRFLVAGYADRLRRDLIDGWSVDVQDLSRSGLFTDALVYPIVLHARRGGSGYRADGAPAAPLDGMLPLAPTHPAGRALFARCMADASPRRLGDLADIRWTVSFHRAGLRDEFVFRERPPGPHARRFLGGGRFAGNKEIGRYRIEWAGGWIDYDRGRAQAAGNAFPPEEVHASPKAVVCQNVRRARVALDTDGYFLKDTLLSLRLRPDQPAETLPWLVIVLNSDVFHYLYEHAYAGTRKGGAYLHFLSRYLAPFPMPPTPPADVVRALHGRLTADPAAAHADAEDAVRRAWGITPAEAAALDAYPMPPI